MFLEIFSEIKYNHNFTQRNPYMELIIGLLAIGVVGYFVFFRKKEDEVIVAPYKVETPAPEPTPAPVVEVKVEEPAPVAVVEATPEPAKKTRKPRAPKAEKPAAKKAAPKKAAAIKATKKSKNA